MIQQYGGHDVLVEPQPDAFRWLEAMYGDTPQITLVNAAIDRVSGARDFYTPRGDASLVASFDRVHLLRHGAAASDVVSRRVDCVTVEDTLARGGLERVDLIPIDAEGYDLEILKTIDLDRLRPTVIRFEFAHFGQAELSDAIVRLGEQSYRFLPEWKDLIAVRTAEASDRSLDRDAFSEQPTPRKLSA